MTDPLKLTLQIEILPRGSETADEVFLRLHDHLFKIDEVVDITEKPNA